MISSQYWLFDDIFVVASNKEFSTYILLHFAVTIYFWQLRMWQTFSWVSIQVNGAADIDYWKILSRWPSTFTGSHFNIQIHTAVDFQAQRYDSFSSVVIASGLFIPPCGLCWLPRGVVYTMCTPRVYHLYLSSLHSVDNYLLWYSLQYETRMESRHIPQKDINQIIGQ